jgi:endonuclease-3
VIVAKVFICLEMEVSVHSSINFQMAQQSSWIDDLNPLLKKYKGRKHPLEYKNYYQLLVMVVLSAQDSDKHINQVAIPLFEAFPNMEALSRATPESLFPYLNSVRNFGNKIKWLISLSQKIGSDKKIPFSMDELTALSGIGRKSANVILREAGKEAEGIIVDLHVVRVAPRLGIASGDKPEKIEKQLMKEIPEKDWGEIGMAISFLGREICRPTNPKCSECVISSCCLYYKGNGKK